MKTILKTKTGFALFFLASTSIGLLLTKEVAAQENFELSPASKITIEGTSNLHDWETKATEFKGKASFSVDRGQIKSIGVVQVTVPVKSIESGKGIMDNKTHEALKVDKYPEISFGLNQVEMTSPGEVKIRGELNIAGITRPVELQASYTTNGTSVAFEGKIPVLMSDFNIDPPTALFGTLKTGDQVTIEYNAVFSK